MKRGKYSIEESQKAPLFPSWRLLLGVTGMFGGCVLYSLRVNMSLAVVCMVTDPMKNETGNATQTPEGQCEGGNTGGVTVRQRPGEFDWDRSQRGYILSAFFVGYVCTQVLGGYLARRLSGKYVVLSGVGLLCVASLCIPVAARTSRNPWVVAALRVLCGIGSGVYFPAFHHLWSEWAPPLERTKLITMVISGNNIGSVIMFASGGYLCDNGFDGGWPSIFYIFGSIGLVWCFFWFLIAADSPSSHRFISDREREYILTSTGNKTQQEKESTPWLKILTSIRIWCIFLTQFCYAWTGYTVLTSLPQYMKDVLKFDIKANGLSNAVPYISMFVLTLFVATVADKLLEKKVFSVTVLRKIIQSFGFIPPAVLSVAIGFMTCEQRILAVVVLCFNVAFTGCSRAGVLCTMVEVAPRYAGIIMGISNTLATITGILSPLAASAIAKDGTPAQWRNVFFLSAGFFAFGEIIFLVFASSEPQSWAIPKEEREVKKELPMEVFKDPYNREKSDYGHHNNAYESELKI